MTKGQLNEMQHHIFIASQFAAIGDTEKMSRALNRAQAILEDEKREIVASCKRSLVLEK